MGPKKRKKEKKEKRKRERDTGTIQYNITHLPDARSVAIAELATTRYSCTGLYIVIIQPLHTPRCLLVLCVLFACLLVVHAVRRESKK